MVARARRIVEGVGGEIATAAETRTLLGLKQSALHPE